MKACKVIASSSQHARAVRTSVNWPNHNQSIRSRDELTALWQFVHQVERAHDAGIPIDTLFVVPRPRREQRSFLRSLDNSITPNGVFRTVIRENNAGGGYGSFDYVFQTFQSEYDWWIFTEDDLIVYGDGYGRKMLDRWHREPNIGFLALVGLEENPPVHCHSGVGLTTRTILEDVCRRNQNALPHHRADCWKRQAVITDGEIPFTNKILQLGYRLVQYGSSEWSPSNLVMPYYDLARSSSGEQLTGSPHIACKHLRTN